MIKKFLTAILLMTIGFAGNAGLAIASETTGSITVGAQAGTADGVIKALPTATPAANTYHATQSVRLVASGSTAICYTTDGTTTPLCNGTTACSAGMKYNAAVSITSTTTLKSRACYGDGTSGLVASDNYILTCSTVSNAATYNAYPTCGAATCNSGYRLSGSACVVFSSSSSGGGGGYAPATVPSSASGAVGTGGGSVSLAGASDSPSVNFTAPAGALGAAAVVTIVKVPGSSSSYVPPAGATGLFMVGGNAFQITAVSGSNPVTNFGKPITLTFTYTAAEIPAGVAEANLKIYYYNATTQAWVEVASTVNTASHTITATVDHLTQFAIYGKKTASGTTATIAQMQALLNSLIAQIKIVVRQMIAQGKYVSPALMIYAQDTSTVPAAKITKAWLLGQSGEEVKTIQTILAKDAVVYPEGKITGYFDAATLAAVKRFQVKYGIAKEGDAGYGYVGPATRAKLNAM